MQQPSKPRTTQRRPSASQRAFTLVELMVALLLLAILAGFAWRGIDGMQRSTQIFTAHSNTVFSLNTVLKQLQTDLDEMRATHAIEAIQFDGASLRFTRNAPQDRSKTVLVVWARKLQNTSGKTALLRWQSLPCTTVADLFDASMRASIWQSDGQSADPAEQAQLLLNDTTEWQAYFYRGSWFNAQSREELENAMAVPEAVRLELNLGASEAVRGKITLDWLRKGVGASRES